MASTQRATEPERAEIPDTEQTSAKVSAPPGDVVVIAGPPRNPLGASDHEPSANNPGGGSVAVAPASDREEMLQVDQMVGQINGRPIFADEFFRPMDARLMREAERLSTKEWIQLARRDIVAALIDRLRDELYLAEFQSSLSAQQKQGVLAFVQRVRDDLISGNLGSESVANRRLVETEGLDLDQKVEDITERQFILAQLRSAIGNRVHVSFWDVRRYYEQNIDQFVPPPVATFIIIRVRSENTAAAQAVEQELAGDRSFEDIAAEVSTWRPDEGNRHVVELKSRELVTERLFGPDSLNDAAQRLSPGQRTDQIEISGSFYWLKLVSIEQPPGTSLYDAQLEIESRLRANRTNQAELRYREQLFDRGSFSDVEDMARRLIEFAAERYLIHNRAGKAAPGRADQGEPDR